MNRRLAAVLAADIVGYSALMGADQEGTLAALRQLRSEVFGPAAAGHRGKVIKSMGDGWLVEFASAAEAVACAMQVQDRLAGHGTIRLRIGVHIGDVVHEDEDVFGDGVNVAARLEALAEPGGLLISDAAFRSLDGTLRPSFDDRGEQPLKNIERPVRTWARQARGGDDGAGGPATAKAARTGCPQLLIRPVATSDDRTEVHELADALTSDLGAYLATVRWLEVSVTDRPAPGGYVVHPTLRARNDRLRLEVRLEDPDGGPAWSGKYDGELADSFGFQDRAAEEAATRIFGAVLDIESAKLAGRSLAEMTAIECNLHGIMQFETMNRETVASAMEHCAAALEKGLRTASAYSDAILTVGSTISMGWGDLVERYRDPCRRWIDEARGLSEQTPLLRVAIASLDYLDNGDAPTLRRAVREAQRREPFLAELNSFCGWCHVWTGDPQNAIDCFRRGERLIRFNPYAATLLGGLALAYVQMGQDRQAIAAAKRGLEITDSYGTLHRALAAAHAHLGDMEDAADAIANALQTTPDDSIAVGRQRSRYVDNEFTRRYFDGLRLAGMPEGEA